MTHEVHAENHAGHGEPEDNPKTLGFAIFYTIIVLVLLLILFLI